MEHAVDKGPIAAQGYVVRLVSLSTHGHRGIYNKALEEALSTEGIVLRPDATERIVDFFPMLDDNIPLFIGRALTNWIMGRQTVGLFFRPGECFRRDHLKYRIKYLVFRLLKHLPSTTMLIIMPFDVDPRFAQVANGWIHDVQFWDLAIVGDTASAEREAMAQSIREAAQGREIIVAVGAQNKSKAFDLFVRQLASDPRLAQRYLFVAGGKVAGDCRGAAEAFTQSGGLLIDRFVSDEELLGLYDVADVVWSCYSPSYNQGSGIFGRAFQSGRPALLRRGSYMEALARAIEHPHLALDFSDTRANGEALLAWRPEPTDLARRARAMAEMRAHAVQILTNALLDGKAA